MIRELSTDEIAGEAFAHLLWLAAEVGAAELSRIAHDELPGLTILGVVDDRVLAFAAFDAGIDPVTIEYIAVDESARARGCGTALVEAVRDRAAARAVRARTDDDAVGFYRGLGFRITECEPDPRWPERRRYDCVLAPRPSTRAPGASEARQ